MPKKGPIGMPADKIVGETEAQYRARTAPPMKKFGGIKSLETIKAQCEALGIEFDASRYARGDDHIAIRSFKGDMTRGYVLFNSFNGNFFGKKPDGTDFDSKSTKHEQEPWFQTLLSFFYSEKGAAT